MRSAAWLPAMSATGNPAPGMYLTGLEPATCGILGRAAERERGTIEADSDILERKYGTRRRRTGVTLRADAIEWARRALSWNVKHFTE